MSIHHTHTHAHTHTHTHTHTRTHTHTPLCTQALADAVKIVEDCSFAIEAGNRAQMLSVVNSCVATKFTHRFGTLMAVGVCALVCACACACVRACVCVCLCVCLCVCVFMCLRMRGCVLLPTACMLHGGPGCGCGWGSSMFQLIAAAGTGGARAGEAAAPSVQGQVQQPWQT